MTQTEITATHRGIALRLSKCAGMRKLVD